MLKKEKIPLISVNTEKCTSKAFSDMVWKNRNQDMIYIVGSQNLSPAMKELLGIKE